MENGTGLKIFSGKSNEPLAKEICSYLGVPLGDALVTSFPDNERALSGLTKISRNRCFLSSINFISS